MQGSCFHSPASVQLGVAFALWPVGNRHHEVDGGGPALPPAPGGEGGQVSLGPGGGSGSLSRSLQPCEGWPGGGGYPTCLCSRISARGRTASLSG